MSTPTIERARELGLPTNTGEVMRRLLLVDVGVVRAALMDVMDGGDTVVGLPWDFDHPFVDVANGTRSRFADAVIDRVQVLQGPTFNLGVKLENLCPQHLFARLQLPAPTVLTCADCDARDGR